MRRQPFDIVHLHEPFAPLLPWLVLQHSRAVNVGTFHAFSENARLYHLGRRAVGRWQRRLHGRIAVSPAARSFVSPHFPGYCYRIIPNGIQYRRFAEARPFPRLRDGRLNILFVGRKDPRKGLRYLLEAFAILQQQRDNVRLIVVGPGKPDRESAGRLAVHRRPRPGRRDADRGRVRAGPAPLLRQRRPVLQSRHRRREFLASCCWRPWRPAPW